MFLKKFSEIAKYVEQSPAEIALFELELSDIAVLDYRGGFGHVDYVRSAAA